MEQPISPSEQNFRSIMQGAPLGLVEITDDGTMAEINTKALSILQVIGGKSVLPGQNFFSISDLISSASHTNRHNRYF